MIEAKVEPEVSVSECKAWKMSSRDSGRSLVEQRGTGHCRTKNVVFYLGNGDDIKGDEVRNVIEEGVPASTRLRRSKYETAVNDHDVKEVEE